MTPPLSLISRAKINWYLNVGGTRPDGYHELETVFQELELGETIEVSPLENPECKLLGFPPDIPPESNLVTRAWQLLLNLYPDQVRGITFKINKSLPHGGGIGGGSSNCAAAIRAIDELYNLNIPKDKLQEIGGQIGSDVAFFVKGGLALGRGRGDLLEQLPTQHRYWLVLLAPQERMSTPKAYAILDKIRKPKTTMSEQALTMEDFLTVFNSGEPTQLATAIRNDFEIVAAQFPWFNECKSRLLKAGALTAFLCGSGSTVAGLAADEESARLIADKCHGILSPTYSPK